MSEPTAPDFDRLYPCTECSTPNCEEECVNSRKVTFNIVDEACKISTDVTMKSHQAIVIWPALQCQDHCSLAKCRSGCFNINNFSGDSYTAKLISSLTIFYCYANLCFANACVTPPKPPKTLGDCDTLKVSPLDVRYLKQLKSNEVIQVLHLSIFLSNEHITRIVGRFLADLICNMTIQEVQELFDMPQSLPNSKIYQNIIDKHKLPFDLFTPEQYDIGNYHNHQFIGYMNQDGIIKNYIPN